MKTIIIGELQIWPEDLGEMTWQEATNVVASLGPGWRLPTIEEFKKTLYRNKEKLPGNVDGYYYWSSTANGNYTWYFSFYSGRADLSRTHSTYYVLAVRDYTVERIVADLLKEF